MLSLHFAAVNSFFVAPAIIRSPIVTSRIAGSTINMYDGEYDRSLTAFVSNLEAKVNDLSNKVGVDGRVAQCVGDECMTVEAYIDALQESASTLEAQWMSMDSSNEWGSAPRRQAVDDSSAPIGLYLERLLAKVTSLADKAGVAVPPQCVGDECYTIEAYIEVLEDAAQQLEASWRTTGSNTEWGSSDVGGGSMAEYVRRLEERVAAQGGGFAQASTLDSYIKSLEAQLSQQNA